MKWNEVEMKYLNRYKRFVMSGQMTIYRAVKSMITGNLHYRTWESIRSKLKAGLIRGENK